MLQQAMSPVISPVLLLNAGSNSLYLHSFITLTLHLLKGALTTLESLDLGFPGYQSGLQQLGVIQTHKHHLV